MGSWEDRHKIVPAVYVLVKNKNEVLLMRRFNTGYMDGKYSLPAGHLEGGESVSMAAVRELKEELAIDTKPDQLKFLTVNHRLDIRGNHERVHFFFELSKWNGEIKNSEPKKCDEIGWFRLTDLPHNIAPEVKEALVCINKKQAYFETNF